MILFSKINLWVEKIIKNGINKISQNIINDFNNKSEGERYNINSFKNILRSIITLFLNYYQILKMS